MNCRICDHNTNHAFTGKVMGKYDVEYLECPNCGFLQTEKPYWLDESYKLPINLTDTGIMYRNQGYANFLSAIVYGLLDAKSKYLDFAGGYGILTRLMRDMGYDFYWDDQFTPNLIARGFEYKPDMGKVEALTVFETFEHFVDPLFEMERMLKISDTIIFSTMVVPTPVPEKNWWYYGFEHGQHVALYRRKTFEYLAEKYGLHFYTNGGDFHMFTSRKLVPKVLTQKDFKSVLAKTSGADAQLLQRSFSHPNTLTLNPMESAKRIYRQIKFGDYYTLAAGISAEDYDKLANIFEQSGILSAVFVSAYNNADTINHFFAEPHLISKRVSDMEYMQPFVLASHK